MLKDFYKTIEVYRKEPKTDSWGNLESQGNYIYAHDIEGYLRPNSGEVTESNHNKVAYSSHTLMCEVGEDIMEFDKVLVDGEYYSIQSVLVYDKSRNLNHTECGADFINNGL